MQLKFVQTAIGKLSIPFILLLFGTSAQADTIGINGKKYTAVAFDNIFELFENNCDSSGNFTYNGQRIAVVGRVWSDGLNKKQVLLDRLFRPGGPDKRLWRKDFIQINVSAIDDMYTRDWLTSCRPISTFQGPDCNILVYGRIAYEPTFERTLNYFSGGACVLFVNGYEYLGKESTTADDWLNFTKSFSNGFRVGRKVFTR